MSGELPDSDSGATPDIPSTVLSSAAGGGDGLFWLESISPILPMFSPGEIDIFRHVLELSQPLYAGKYLSTGESVNQHVLDAVSVLASLRVDSDTLVAGMLQF